jgi:hypothetical protein
MNSNFFKIDIFNLTIKVFFIMVLLAKGNFLYSQHIEITDTIEYSVSDEGIVKMEDEYYGFVLNEIDSSIVLIDIYNNEGRLMKTIERFYFEIGFNRYDSFEISSGGVVVSEIGQSRFLGIINSEYVFEVFDFHREGVTNYLLSYNMQFRPVKKHIIYFNRQGEILGSKDILYILRSKI